MRAEGQRGRGAAEPARLQTARALTPISLSGSRGGGGGGAGGRSRGGAGGGGKGRGDTERGARERQSWANDISELAALVGALFLCPDKSTQSIQENTFRHTILQRPHLEWFLFCCLHSQALFKIYSIFILISSCVFGHIYTIDVTKAHFYENNCWDQTLWEQRCFLFDLRIKRSREIMLTSAFSHILFSSLIPSMFGRRGYSSRIR